MAIIPTATHRKENTEKERSLWTPCTQILGVCTTFTVMYGSGWKMAGTTTIMVPQRTELHGYLAMKEGDCGVVLGTTLLGTLVRLTVAGTTEALGTTSTAFGWCWFHSCRRPGSFTL